MWAEWSGGIFCCLVSLAILAAGQGIDFAVSRVRG
jgi:hypothetical protein